MAGKTSADPNVFILPDLGEGVHEAELIAWKVKPGDTVKEHDVVAEMETDKALVEVPSPRDGTIKTLHGSEGETLHVGNPLVTYEGGTASPAQAEPRNPAASDKPSGNSNNGTAPGEGEDAGTVVGAMQDGSAGITARDGKPLAAPAVRRLARDLGVDLALVPGTGIAGRITAKDVRVFHEAGGANNTRAPEPASRSAAPAQPAPGAPDLRRPMPHQEPRAQPHVGGYQQHHAAPYQPQPQPGPAYPQTQMQPGLPAYGYPPMGYMMIPVPVPMPFGMPGTQQPAVPHAPGFTPFPSGRTVPGPAQQSQASDRQPESRQPFRGVRKTIANRLRESVDTAVHFTVVDEAEVTELDALRKRLAQETGQKVSFLPFVCAAVCRAISPTLGGRFGALNATVDDQNEEIVQHGRVHLGIATDTDSGLMVPVLPRADGMGVLELSRSINDTATAARDRSIPRDRLMGSTFTITNVGSHAGRFATPVINYPEVAILAVGKVYDGVVVRDGQPVVGKVMPLSLACDHRVVDGASAALCLAEIVHVLQHQASTLV